MKEQKEPVDPLLALGQTYRVERDFTGSAYIRHSFGRIYTLSKNAFAVLLEDSHPKITAKLIDVGGEVRNFNELYKTVAFPFESFDLVAEIVRARKKKTISPELRERLRAMGYKRERLRPQITRRAR